MTSRVVNIVNIVNITIFLSVSHELSLFFHGFPKKKRFSHGFSHGFPMVFLSASRFQRRQSRFTKDTLRHRFSRAALLKPTLPESSGGGIEPLNTGVLDDPGRPCLVSP